MPSRARIHPTVGEGRGPGLLLCAPRFGLPVNGGQVAAHDDLPLRTVPGERSLIGAVRGRNLVSGGARNIRLPIQGVVRAGPQVLAVVEQHNMVRAVGTALGTHHNPRQLNIRIIV